MGIRIAPAKNGMMAFSRGKTNIKMPASNIAAIATGLKTLPVTPPPNAFCLSVSGSTTHSFFIRRFLSPRCTPVCAVRSGTLRIARLYRRNFHFRVPGRPSVDSQPIAFKLLESPPENGGHETLAASNPNGPKVAPGSSQFPPHNRPQPGQPAVCFGNVEDALQDSRAALTDDFGRRFMSQSTRKFVLPRRQGFPDESPRSL